MIARLHITSAVMLSVEWPGSPSQEEPKSEPAILTPALLSARRIAARFSVDEYGRRSRVGAKTISTIENRRHVPSPRTPLRRCAVPERNLTPPKKAS